ncbi:hypothetical protein VNO77_22737 [Canavalia gladiata]|uniref:Uncharacterized protein n=1 Tax=Canavalia gladiata TaxID=3824 RepID=A0AAN9QB95_CANGL
MDAGYVCLLKYWSKEKPLLSQLLAPNLYEHLLAHPLKGQDYIVPWGHYILDNLSSEPLHTSKRAISFPCKGEFAMSWGSIPCSDVAMWLHRTGNRPRIAFGIFEQSSSDFSPIDPLERVLRELSRTRSDLESPDSGQPKEQNYHDGVEQSFLSHSNKTDLRVRVTIKRTDLHHMIMLDKLIAQQEDVSTTTGLAVNLDPKALTTSSSTATDTPSPEFQWRAILRSPKWRHSSGASRENQFPNFLPSSSINPLLLPVDF